MELGIHDRSRRTLALSRAARIVPSTQWRARRQGDSPHDPMNYAALLGSALWSLLRNKTRSLLTVLGITIGIAAVICVVAIGQAGQARVEQQLNNLGDNFVWIEAGGR